MAKESGAHLLTPQNGHWNALQGTLSARPFRGALSSAVLASRFPVSFWTAAEAARIGLLVSWFSLCLCSCFSVGPLPTVRVNQRSGILASAILRESFQQGWTHADGARALSSASSLGAIPGWKQLAPQRNHTGGSEPAAGAGRERVWAGLRYGGAEKPVNSDQ